MQEVLAKNFEVWNKAPNTVELLGYDPISYDFPVPMLAIENRKIDSVHSRFFFISSYFPGKRDLSAPMFSTVQAKLRLYNMLSGHALSTLDKDKSAPATTVSPQYSITCVVKMSAYTQFSECMSAFLPEEAANKPNSRSTNTGLLKLQKTIMHISGCWSPSSSACMGILCRNDSLSASRYVNVNYSWLHQAFHWLWIVCFLSKFFLTFISKTYEWGSTVITHCTLKQTMTYAMITGSLATYYSRKDKVQNFWVSTPLKKKKEKGHKISF